MRTCPACHRWVPDTATVCPQEGCGCTLPSPAHVKRPPPPSAKIQLGAGERAPAPNAAGTAGPRTSARSAVNSRLLLFAGAGAAVAILSASLGVGIGYYWWKANGALAQRPANGSRTKTSRQASRGPAASTEEKSSSVAAESPPEASSPRGPSSGDESPARSKPPVVGRNPPPEKPEKPRAEKKKETGGKLGMVTDPMRARLGEVAEPPQPKTAIPREPPKAVALPAEPLSLKALYAPRIEPDRRALLAEAGGTAESEAAVAAGLDWLARHQADDGHWGADCFGSRCDPIAPCSQPGKSFQPAQTALALLAYQAGGNFDFNGEKYSDRVKRGLEWLVARQDSDGSLLGEESLSAMPGTGQSYFMYEHAIATFALADACAGAVAAGREPDPRYLAGLTKAVHYIEGLQHLDGGWRYMKDPTEVSDVSVSEWPMLALKTAQEAGVEIQPATFTRMVAFFKSRLSPIDGTTDYREDSGIVSDASTAIGMLVDAFLLHQPDSPLVRLAASSLLENYEQTWTPLGDAGLDEYRYYVFYNCALAMFQAGGDSWRRWNAMARDKLISLQVQGHGCDRGSWVNTNWTVDEGGRVYTTALAVLTLEVYYRYQRVSEQQAGESDAPSTTGRGGP